MPRKNVTRLVLPTIVLIVLTSLNGFADPPHSLPPAPEVIAAPSAQLPPWPRRDYGRTNPCQVLVPPRASEHPLPPPIQPAPLAISDRPLPINLATALCLSHARPLVIASAQASVEEAAAVVQGANVMWLPNLNVGTNYYRHDGTDQSTDGTIILADKQALTAGGGAVLAFGVTDAIFLPLVARRELAAREYDLETARNEALMWVAVSYFDVQQARGQLAGTLDAVAKAQVLVERTSGLARGLVPEIESDRAKSLLFDLRQQAATGRANWRIASARLARVLRLNPSVVVVPVEPPHLQVSLVAQELSAADLVPVGLANRPELASQRAIVQATVERVEQERFRPFIPAVVVQGRNGPFGGFEGSVFGGGPDGGGQLYGGRFDMDVGVVWTLANLGAGNRTIVHQRVAQEERAAIELANTQDRVAEDVVRTHAQLEATAAQINDAAAGVREALLTYEGTLKGISETRGAGDLLQLVNRPQEAVAAVQQLSRAYNAYFAAINGYNRAQFQLYWALGFPARSLICDHPLGAVDRIDTSRPEQMSPIHSRDWGRP